MSQVNQVNPGGRPNPLNPTGQHVHVPTREKANEQQVHTVLAIVGHLQPYLLLHHRSEEENFKREYPEMDGGAVAVAVRTLDSACVRLEKMLADDSRWIATDGDSIVESVKRTQAEIQKYYTEQATTIAEMRRPSRIFHPKFAKMGDVFTAYHASSDFPGGIIIGQGATPADAMADFDRAFNRIPAEQLRFNEESLRKIHAAGVEVDVPVEEVPPVKRKARRTRKK